MTKLIKACIALAAFAAFAVVPSIASATNDPNVTIPTGTSAAPTHASPIAITATNEGPTVLTNANTETLISCEHAELKGNLETNSPTPTAEAKLEGTITAASFTSPKHATGTECTSASFGTILVTPSVAGSSGPLPWCLRATATMKTNEFQVRGGGCTEASRPITFQLHITSLGLTCSYIRSAAISGTYTTHPAAAQLAIDHIEFSGSGEGNSFFCPTNGFLDMKFNLKTASGGNVFIDNHDGK